MNESKKKIIEEIQKRNSVKIEEDDPLMVLYTFNELLLEEYKEKQKKIINEFENSINNWNLNISEKANKVIIKILESKENENYEILLFLKKIDKKLKSIINLFFITFLLFLLLLLLCFIIFLLL